MNDPNQPMSGVASETGSISPTIVAKIVIDNIMVTPAKNLYHCNFSTSDFNYISRILILMRPYLVDWVVFGSLTPS